MFNRIRADGLKLRPTKRRFLRKEVAFLGHVVSSEGMKTEPGKGKAVKTRPVPLNVKKFKASLALLTITGNLFSGFPSSLSLFINCVGRMCHLIGSRSNR